MSLETNLVNLATRQATEAKALRTLINGNLADLSGLSTTAKANLVAAINEVLAIAEAAGESGGATTFNELSDVTIGSPATGHIVRFNGSEWVNVLGTVHFQAADDDLAAIAALATTAWGRDLLTLANAAALTALVEAASETAAGKVELASTAEATTGTDATRAVTPAGLKAVRDALKDEILGAGVPAALDTLDELAAALGDDANFAATVTTSLAGKQPLDATLTALAGAATAANKLIYFNGVDTVAVADFTAFGRTLVSSADAAAARTSLDVYSKTEIGNPERDLVAVFEAGLT